MKTIFLFRGRAAYLSLLVPYCLVALISTERNLVRQIRNAEWKEESLIKLPIIAIITNSSFSSQNVVSNESYLAISKYVPSSKYTKSESKYVRCSRYTPELCNVWRCGENGIPCNNDTTGATVTSTDPVSIDNPIHIQPMEVAECSCVGTLDRSYCCQRAIIVIHKMGLTVIQELTEAFFSKSTGRYVDTPQIMKNHPYGQLFDDMFRLPSARDYRHVVVTRNWYDAIISGYLYHKSGKECWLDWFGHAGHEGWLLNNTLENWEQRLLQDPTTMAQNHPWPPGNDRDLCQYLTEESDEVGMRVYTAWAMSSFMDPLLDFHRRRQEMEQRNGWNRTVFLCYEQFMTPSAAYTTVTDSVFDWFFPNQTSNLNANPLQYRHGHATDQDPKLRSRLNDMVSRIDDELYHGAISQGSAEFGCGYDQKAASRKRNG